MSAVLMFEKYETVPNELAYTVIFIKLLKLYLSLKID